ncbi:MAG: zinc-binding dehydrogenase [Saprospiraceae bacterium]|jgi:alcohol dehydrogenase
MEKNGTQGIRYRVKPGSLGNFYQESYELPALETGFARIRVKAIGLNFADIFAAQGLYKAAPKDAFTPGLEYAGIVESVADGVQDFKPGDRVMGVIRFGAYSSHVDTDARYLVHLPDSWDFETGAAYPVQTITAYYGMLTLGALKPGQTMLIHSAAGGVGLQALKIAKAMGCYTIGTIGSESKKKFTEEQGCARVLVRGESFESDLRSALEDRDLHLVMDSIGGDYFSIPYRLLAPMGRVVVYGSARYATRTDKPNKLHMLYHYFRRPKIDPQTLPERNKGLLGFNLIWLYNQVGLMHEVLKELEALQLEPPYVGHRFQFDELPDALRLFQSGKTMGKVVVLVD